MKRHTVAAIVPMRHNSERVPGKNFRSFAGRPLYHRIVETLLGCTAIDTVVIDTDSPTILDEAARLFPAVRLLERPAHLRAGETPMNDVLLHTTGVVEADLYLQTHSTNPLLQSATVQQALEALLGTYPSFDSLFGVTRLQTRLWDPLARAINHNPSILLRTQDLPPIYEENSCLYVFDRETLQRRHNRIGDRPQLFEVPRNEAWDIDEEIDFEVAEFLFQRRQEG